MGYETHFRLKEKLDEQFEPFTCNITKEDIEKYKSILLAVCMLTNIEDNNHIELVKAYGKIEASFKLYAQYLEQSWKLWLKKELEKEDDYTQKNEICFCGWDCADNKCAYTDLDELKTFYLNNIFAYAVEKGSNPFEHEDLYYKKSEKLCSWIDEFEDSFNDNMKYEFISFYRGHPELADESDGLSHFYPEEKEEKDDE